MPFFTQKNVSRLRNLTLLLNKLVLPWSNIILCKYQGCLNDPSFRMQDGPIIPLLLDEIGHSFVNLGSSQTGQTIK